MYGQRIAPAGYVHVTMRNLHPVILPRLFSHEVVAKQMIEAKAGKAKLPKVALNVDLRQMVEEQRVVLGIHEVYGEVYRHLSFDTLLPQKRYHASHEACSIA